MDGDDQPDGLLSIFAAGFSCKPGPLSDYLLLCAFEVIQQDEPRLCHLQKRAER